MFGNNYIQEQFDKNKIGIFNNEFTNHLPGNEATLDKFLWNKYDELPPMRRIVVVPRVERPPTPHVTPRAPRVGEESDTDRDEDDEGPIGMHPD